MGQSPVEYLVILDGLEATEAGRAAGAALALVAEEMAWAETDIPWEQREQWPEQVAEAASRLRNHFVPQAEHGAPYSQTGVRSVADAQIREDFITFAPYAYDATFWGPDHQEVATLADEGQSFVIWLTDHQRGLLAQSLGADRVVSLAEWRRAHPSIWSQWLDRLPLPRLKQHR
ncbi:MAG TPA: hypothetical protein VFX33_09695 [Actinomycetales bacterium]|nr:hypothetical protein [Actinomycetales bacterium]